MSGLKDCYDMMDEADEVVQKIYDMCEGDNCGEFWWSLSWPRKALKSMVAAVKAGQPTDAGFFREWDWVISEALDHMLEERLAGHAWKEVADEVFEPDFKKWSKFDVKVYKLFDELTAVFKKLVETCKPANEARIAANRAAAGLPTVAARNAQKAENKIAYNAKVQGAKNVAAAARQAAKNAKKAEEQAAANAKKAAMTNAERQAAANRAAKAAATRKAKKNAELAAGQALLAANSGRPKRGEVPPLDSREAWSNLMRMQNRASRKNRRN
jgi:hypothetical protein